MTKIKICGIKTLPDALAAIEAGADLLGFNFYPKSPRSINAAACRQITLGLREKYPGLLLVGVFVNSPADEIRAILQAAGLDLAQLHGDETPQMLAELGPLAFKAVRLPSAILQRECDIQSVLDSAFVRDCAAGSADRPRLLLDASAPGLYGGSGLTTDWAAAAQIARQHPILLAGGLTPANVAQAVRQVQPWGVDVASGVESSPGVKDPQKMKKFVEQVHSKQSLAIGNFRPSLTNPQ
ncbi:MAG: phosphoribosylanthranilate isomerase [Anaerolineales bacterium]|jgi:phosphoribosylanthranilate isomerase|nr:phosphoribosylanthranilate isomerase [Anaerolineales bacterium]